MALFVALSVSASAKQAAQDPYKAVGQPVSCIPISSYSSTHIRDDQTIDFEVNTKTIYRNKMPYSCPGLAAEGRFLFKTSMSQICSVDMISVLQNFGGTFSEGAHCGLGTFQKMEKPPK
jgi:hypothetical protein